MINFEYFGTSHSRYIGCTAHNVPPGFTVDINLIKANLRKRSSSFVFNTSRVEEDKVIFIDGVRGSNIYKDKFSFVIENKNIRTKDYLKGVLRPSHADYIGYMIEGESYDYSGGGPFSGRLTALYVVVGSIIEANKNYGKIHSHISQIMNFKDDDIRRKSLHELELLDESFPVFNNAIKKEMIKYVEQVAKNKDSVGGELTFCISGIDFGFGGYQMNSFESILSKYIYSIGAIKGITFGLGRDYLNVLGSQANDSYFYSGSLYSKNNRQGGINGGFTNGYESVVFSVIIRPTPTIFKEQKTVQMVNGEYKEIIFIPKGRHDSFIVNRINQVIKSAIYMALLEMEETKYEKNRT